METTRASVANGGGGIRSHSSIAIGLWDHFQHGPTTTAGNYLYLRSDGLFAAGRQKRRSANHTTRIEGRSRCAVSSHLPRRRRRVGLCCAASWWWSSSSSTIGGTSNSFVAAGDRRGTYGRGPWSDRCRNDPATDDIGGRNGVVGDTHHHPPPGP